MRECPKGKPCLATCISRSYVCKADFPNPVGNLLGKAKRFVEKEGGHLADHLGKNVAAWKVGKTLGGLVSSYLESRYGIPREMSGKISETVIQGLAATGLDIKNLRNVDEVAKKLFTEMAAAFVGKTSHTGVETIVSAKELSATLESALPILAGKITGIGTSMLSNKLPTPREALNIITSRSKEDIEKIKNLLTRSTQENFSEFSSEEKMAEFLGDFSLIVLLSLKGKIVK
jgi:hypothetical protein